MQILKHRLSLFVAAGVIVGLGVLAIAMSGHNPSPRYVRERFDRRLPPGCEVVSFQYEPDSKLLNCTVKHKDYGDPYGVEYVLVRSGYDTSVLVVPYRRFPETGERVLLAELKFLTDDNSLSLRKVGAAGAAEGPKIEAVAKQIAKAAAESF